MKNEDTAIRVENLSKTFRLPHEKSSSLKSSIVNFSKHDKGYEVQEALNDISFEVKKGEFFGIVGRNGSGKSTLLKTLAGIYSPTKGEVEVNGRLIPFIELGVGFSPELTGRENIFLNGALLGFSRAEMSKMYDEIVEFSEIGRFMDQKLKNYSSGMQVRLAFSIAIRAQGDILLLDEVLAVGDASFQQKCYDYFQELKQQNKTVVFVSHDMGAVRRFCTQAIYIENGNLTYKGSPTEIATLYVEENLDNNRKIAQKSGNEASGAYELSSKITDKAKSSVTININFKSKVQEPLYIGISILKDGVSFAEINTLRQLQLKKNGEVSYVLDTSPLNDGVYEVTAALFKEKNKELVAVSREKNEFNLKNLPEDEEVKGAALRLADTWKKV